MRKFRKDRSKYSKYISLTEKRKKDIQKRIKLYFKKHKINDQINEQINEQINLFGERSNE